MNDTTHKVLVVDDVEDIRNGIKDILENIGYIVTTAANGIQAISIIKDKPIDLIITDILMPDMDGIELCRKTKELYPDMKFILISGGGRQTTNPVGYDYLGSAKKLTGINDILKKPFDPQDLIELINSKLKST